MCISSILFSLLLVILSLYLYLKWHYSYWKRVGLEYLKPELFYGNTRDMAKQKVSMGDQFGSIYNQMKSKGYKHGGLYVFFSPVYMPIDLEFIKNILQRDFAHFVNHGIYIDEERDPLSGHLFALENEKWKNLRSKLSPAFTSAKLKMVHPTIVDCTFGLKDILENHAKIQDAIEIKDLASRFTIDVIGSIGFGIECNSLADPNSAFIEAVGKIFNLNTIQRIKETAMFALHLKLLRLFNYKFFSEEVETFFLNVIKTTIDFRESNNVCRKDLMHLLIQLKNRGKVCDDEFITKQDGESNGTDFITFNELAAQCMIFFIAGFETSATTMSFALLELAIHPDLQHELREEILSVLEKHNGELTYDAINEMKFLEKVIYETLRKHPPAPNLPRQCTKDYKVPGTNVIIKKGIRVIIPVFGINHDPEIYPDPTKFDPERFNEENIEKRHSVAFLSFGEGPRYCLGARLGILQTKVGLASMIRNFSFNLHHKTQLPIKYLTERFLLTTEGGIWLTVSNVDQ